jgi:hypothetical protein
MHAQRGSALILALMMLAFLMILGTALLTSVNLDVAIGENYRSGAQLLYLAELGIEEARGALLRSPRTPTELLHEAAGPDGVLSGSQNLDTLLDVTDDTPLIDGGDRTAGQVRVFLRNDAADGMRSAADSNQVLTLLSVAAIGNSRKALEVSIMKWRFPKLPASLVLAGSPASFAPAGAMTEISGVDSSAQGADRSAIGVLTIEDQAAVQESNPTQADIAVVDALLDSRLRTPSGAERMVERIIAKASDRMDPGWSGTSTVGSMGASNDYRIVAVNGDCVLGSGTGFGVLLVRGNLVLTGSFRWNGLILVIGQGSITWTGTGSGIVSGGMFVMRTRANDRSAANVLGTLLPVAGPVNVDFSGTDSSIRLENPGVAAMDLVNQKLPYVPIAVREY